MGIREVLSLIFALVLGLPLGCGIAFTFWGSLLNRSNTHGDYVGESSKYTKGLKYTDRADKINKKNQRDLYITANYKPLQKEAIYKDNKTLVKRPAKITKRTL